MESNGPDVKIRGTAAHIAEKYAALARDALSSGDTVAGENYLQHAEHYNRIIMAHQQTQQAENANANGSGRGRGNGADEPEANEPLEAKSSGDSGGDEVAADEGVARTIARTTRNKSNGSGDDTSDSGQSGDETAS